MTTPKNVMKTIKDSDVKYVDFRSPIRAASGSTSLSTSA